VTTIEHRFIVLDEDGIPIRKFHWKDEALRFMQEGWTLKVLPKLRKPKIDWDQFEPALF
jgi:hypothetical protein